MIPALVGVVSLAVVTTGLTTLAGGRDHGDSDVVTRIVLPPDRALTPVRRPDILRPGYLVGITDPTFGSTVRRVSDNHAFRSTGMWLRQSHAKLQPWNSDGTRLLLGYTDPGFLIDGRTYAFDGQLLHKASSGVWSNVDPDTFYSVQGNQLLRISARSGRSEVAHDFAGWTSVDIGHGEGSPSNDDRSIALIASDAERVAVIVYDLVRDEVVSTLPMPRWAGEGLDWAAVSQSGSYVVLNWVEDGAGRGRGIDVYDRDLRFVRHLADVSEQGDLGYDAAGQEVYVTFDPARGKRDGDQQRIVALGLEDGRMRLLQRTDWVGTHVSCRNLERPGWCYVSDASADAPRAGTGGFDEIFALKLDGSGTVQRFAHAHQSKGVPYDWTTLAVPSRDGTRVLWASDWGLGTVAPAYAYVASFDDLVGDRG